MAEKDIDALIEKSASTDVQVLLNAKEQAKRQSLEDPSAADLTAFERASKMLEKAVDAKTNFKNWREVLVYLKDEGRKVGQTKLFDDINKGRLRKQTDGSFKQRDVDRYAASLKMSGTSDIRNVRHMRRPEENASHSPHPARSSRSEGRGTGISSRLAGIRRF